MLMRHGVNDRDVRVDFYRLAIENRRPVAPLADGFERRLDEHGIAADNFERLDRAVRCDSGVQFYTPFLVNLFRQIRINRLNAVNQHRRVEARPAHDRWPWDALLDGWWRWHRAPCVGNWEQPSRSPRNAETQPLGCVIRPLVRSGGAVRHDDARNVLQYAKVTRTTLLAVGTRNAGIARWARIGRVR